MRQTAKACRRRFCRGRVSNEHAARRAARACGLRSQCDPDHRAGCARAIDQRTLCRARGLADVLCRAASALSLGQSARYDRWEITVTPTLIIDRTFKGVGRIKIRTGTRLPAVRRKFSRMLTALADEGRVDMLRALRDGRIHIMQLHDAYQRKALDQLPSAETSRPLAPAMRDWIALFGETKHAASLETSLGYLESARPNALISDLPHLLLTLRVTLGQSHPRSFNMLRSAASGFIRQTLTRSHSLYPQVLAVERVPVKKTRRHRPLTVAEMRAWFPNPQIDDLDAIAWGMATTGMGCGEYWGRWSVMLDRVHIEGTKSEHYVRD